MDMFCEWNYATLGPVPLAFFTEHNVFEVHPFCGRYQSIFPFSCQLMFHCMDLWYCFVHSPIVGHLDHFHFLMIVNNAAGNPCVEICFSFFLTSYSRRELLGYVAALYLTFWGTAKLLSRAHVQFHILTIYAPALVVVFLIIANLWIWSVISSFFFLSFLFPL